MKIRTLALILAVLLAAAFVALNLEEFFRPTVLNFGVAQIQAPLGLLMLGALVVVFTLALAVLAYVQTAHGRDLRQMQREVSDQRTLADSAEASRFTELRTLLESLMAQAERTQRELAGQTAANTAKSEASILKSIEESANGLAASVGELEDRLARERRTDLARG
jgi:uncharacterized integral membrane protein